MTWLRRKREVEAAAHRLEAAEKLVDQIVNRAARIVRLQAEAEFYTRLKKKGQR